MRSDAGQLPTSIDLPDRRQALARGGLYAALCACGLWSPVSASAANEAPAAGTAPANETLRALGAVDANAGDVLLDIPDVAENGAAVPVSVESRLPDVREIFLIVDSNPIPMVVVFKIPEGTDAFVSTRVKMADSGNVYAVVRSGGRLLSSCKSTKVTVGGCG